MNADRTRPRRVLPANAGDDWLFWDPETIHRYPDATAAGSARTGRPCSRTDSANLVPLAGTPSIRVK